LLALLCAVIFIFSVLPGAFAAPSCLVASQAPENALSYSWINSVNLAADIGLEDFTLLTPPGPVSFEHALRSVCSFTSDGASIGRSLVIRGLQAVRSLVSARPRNPLCDNGFSPPRQFMPSVSDIQACSLRFSSRLLHAGVPDEQVPKVGKCLSASLKAEDTIHGEKLTTVRGYDEDKLHVLKAGHTTVDLLDVTDAATCLWFSDPDKFILRV